MGLLGPDAMVFLAFARAFGAAGEGGGLFPASLFSLPEVRRITGVPEIRVPAALNAL